MSNTEHCSHCKAKDIQFYCCYYNNSLTKCDGLICKACSVKEHECKYCIDHFNDLCNENDEWLKKKQAKHEMRNKVKEMTSSLECSTLNKSDKEN